jgi:ceramide glucosyltransferase
MMWILVFILCAIGFYFCSQAGRAYDSAALAKVVEPRVNGDSPWVKVSIVKPVRGANASSEKCFRSWIESQYPGEFEIIFSFQDPDDPALPIAKRLMTSEKIKVIVNPILDGYSGKASNLEHGSKVATGEILIFSDADTLAGPQTLIEIVRLLLPGKVLVSCLPAHKNAQNFWARMYMTIWNHALIGLWGPSMLAQRAPGVAGGTVGFWRRDLELVGGVKAFSNFVAEDLQMGRLFQGLGYKLCLGPLIECEVGSLSWRSSWNSLVRSGFVSIQEGRVLGFILNFVAYGYVPGLILSVLGEREWLWQFITLAIAKICFYSHSNWLASGRKSWRLMLEAPLLDIILLVAFIRAFLYPEMTWADIAYRIYPGGRMEKN